MGLFDWLSPNASVGDPTQTAPGVMGLMANPQTAGALGLAQGLLSASGPSRMPVSFGQALNAGFGGMQQGALGAMQMQRQMMQMHALQGLMGMSGEGGSGQPGVAAPTPAPSYSSMFGTSTPTAAQMPAPSMAPAASAAPAGPMIYGRTPQQLFQQGILMSFAGIQGGGDLMRVAVEHDPTLALQMPTDLQKNASAAYGYGTPAYTNVLQGTLDKGTITSLRPGAPYVRGNQVFGTPPNAPQGFMNQPNGDGSWSIVPVSGGAQAVSASAAAKTAGEGSALPFTEGKDAAGNPLPIMSRTQAATGNLPAPLMNNNPGALMPGGRLAQYPDMQTGLSALDANLASYGKQGVGTLADAITKWAPPNENNTQAYIQDVSQRLGIKPNQPIDLSNPAQRQAIGTAIMLHENGPGAVFASGARGGAIYAAPPMGATNAANASQTAPSKQMAESQDALSSQDANYQQSRASLLKMMAITQNGGFGDTVARMLPENLATRVSNDAAEYQKAHANYVSLQGKALGSGGTDASRAMLDEAVPTFEKPADAKISGLTDQLNQLDLAHLKRQTLTPTYQQGNEKTYTDLSAQFDKTVTPQMMPKLMPILSMPASPARTQALQQAIQDPQMKAALDLMVRTGQLK